MFFDIKQLQLGKVRFNETFAPGAIEFFDQQIKLSAPIVTAGTAELMEALMEIRVAGHLKTEIESTCDRCLEPTSLPVDKEFDLIYRPAAMAPEGEEVEVAQKETEVGFYEGEGLELSDVIREQILLDLPMRKTCSEECKGICPVCGQNRNMVQCACHEEPADDRWLGLKNL